MRNEKGFTLVEILIAAAVIAVIGSSLVTAMSQIFIINNAHRDHMEAVKQVENALHYINRDAQMAGEILPDPVTDFPLVLTWNEWDETTNMLNGPHHQVTYSILDNNLERDEIVTEGGTTTVNSMVVASHIDNISECSFTDPVLIVSMTVSFNGYRTISETRTLKVQSRPESIPLSE